MSRKASPAPSLHPFAIQLANVVAQTSFLPHPDTVKALGRAVFPVVRTRKSHRRNSTFEEAGVQVGMYDDNTTPRWARMWAHGYLQN